MLIVRFVSKPVSRAGWKTGFLYREICQPCPFTQRRVFPVIQTLSLSLSKEKCMSNRRRIIIVTISICIGSLMSVGLFYKRGNGNLDNNAVLNLVTNFVFSLVIVLAIGMFFVWNNKKGKS